MDFFTKIPRTSKGHESIWVKIERLIKSGHFLPIHEEYKMENLSHIHIDKIVALHGVRLSIISNRDSRFMSRLWRMLKKALGTQINLSIAYHPQTNSQMERMIQTLQDMLRACAIKFNGNWDNHFPLIEFFYNNSVTTRVSNTVL